MIVIVTLLRPGVVGFRLRAQVRAGRAATRLDAAVPTQ